MNETGRSEYIELLELLRKCLVGENTVYEEIYVTPLRSGYRVEIYPEPSLSTLRHLAECISRNRGVYVEVKKYPYGLVLVIKT